MSLLVRDLMLTIMFYTNHAQDMQKKAAWPGESHLVFSEEAK